MKKLTIIGRTDKIDLPDLGLFDIECKIDTGAYGNALHCHHIKVIELDGLETLSFRVLDPTHQEYAGKTYYSRNFSKKSVKSSSGVSESRYIIKTNMILFGKKRIVSFSLTDRASMKFPILIGRKFLTRRFLVDVDQKDLSYKGKNA